MKMKELYQIILKNIHSIKITVFPCKRSCYFSPEKDVRPTIQVTRLGMPYGHIIIPSNILDTRFNIKFIHNILNSCNYNDSQKKFDRTNIYYSFYVRYNGELTFGSRYTLSSYNIRI